MTYRDDRLGRFAPGLCVSDKVHGAADCGGLRGAWAGLHDGGSRDEPDLEVPKVHDQGNYASYEDQVEKSPVDFNKQVAAGYLEGPLLYKPRIINKQAGIWDEIK